MSSRIISFGLLGLLLGGSAQAWAEEAFAPTAAERATISVCIARTASEPELQQMSACIGLIAGPCVEAPDANTFSLVACHMREQTIWDEYLNTWYGEAQDRLKDDTAAAGALKAAQRTWIAFRAAKCAYWAKRYDGGTIVSVLTGDCMRIETGRRALEMRAIFDDLDH
ncbi:MAG: lysozyme inhibitor LprI family protein [Methyloceanibacter sp.]